jgi:geranylgeranyl pyrophosphate synthase
MSPIELAKIFYISELPDYFDKIERRMLSLVSNANPLITTPMTRLIKGLNKRFAMFFVLPVVISQGHDVDDSVIACCAALELLSIAFCIHDDVTDNSNKRYGVPNINAIEGINQAILIGDFIMNLAVQEALAVSQEIAEAFINSIAKNRESEIIEVADRNNIDRTIDSYLNCIKLKTASHFSASCQVGALCAGLSQAQVDAYAKYGDSVGMTYQLVDDLLDLISTESVMGKTIGKDIEEGVYTLQLLLGLNSPQKNNIKSMLKSRKMNQVVSSELLKILFSCGAIEKTIQEIRENNERAAAALKGLNNNDALKGLARFPSQYLDLSLEFSAVKLRGLITSQ